MESLILLGSGSVSICVFILAAQVFVGAWELWDKGREGRKRQQKTYPEPRRKAAEDYWKGAA